jgi:RNA recognition motif-containing protein
MRNTSRLFVYNVPYKATEREVRDAFAAIVGVAGVEIPRDIQTGNGRGFGFVDVISVDDAKLAIATSEKREHSNRKSRRPDRTSQARPVN